MGTECSKPQPSSAESVDDDCNLYGLFICEDYVEKSWQFGELTQPLLCSNMSSTDHDLTGQIVWPACVLLSWFIYHNRAKFTDKVVVELGAGCGLGGFVAANFCKSCTITDGNDIVCELLKRNKEHLNFGNVEIAKLLWGIKEEVDVNTVTKPDIIIGADVILWPNQIIALLHTIRWLLEGKKNEAVCYISYIVRANTTTERLFATAAKLGLDISTVPIEEFVPADCHEFDTLQKMLLCITLNAQMTEEELSAAVTELEKHTSEMDIHSRPC